MAETEWIFHLKINLIICITNEFRIVILVTFVRMVEINSDQAIARIKENFSKLSEKEIAAGISAAINRTLISGRVEGTKGIKGKYNIKRDILDTAFKIKKATSAVQIGEIKASSKSIGLSHFQPTFSFNKRSTTKYNKKGVGSTKLLKGKSKQFGQGVTVEIIKGQKKVIPYAFMIAGKMPVFARGKYENSGSFAFMQRHKRASATGNDSPISSLVNISVYSSLVNDRVMPNVSTKINDKLKERMTHELTFRLSKMTSQ